jgi:voltage-gated potassium channel Kch
MVLAVLLTAGWLVFGGTAALQAVTGPPAAQSEASQAADAQPKAHPIVVKATDFICVLRTGKTCDEGQPAAEQEARLSQGALSILAFATVVFGFWSQLFETASRALRWIGYGHAIVIGDGRLARTVVARLARRPLPGQGGAVLVMSHGSSEDQVALASERVDAVIGAWDAPATLTSAGLERASRVICAGGGDADNLTAADLAAARMFPRARPEPGRVLVRIESRDLREQLAASARLRVSDMFSLAALEAAEFLRQRELYAGSGLGASGFHVGIVGWDEAGLELAASCLRTLWVPGGAPPRVTVWHRDAADAQERFRAAYPGLEGASAAYWGSDPASAPGVDFVGYDPFVLDSPWDPIAEGHARRALSAIAIVADDPDERLHVCARLAARRPGDFTAPVFARRTIDDPGAQAQVFGDKILSYGGQAGVIDGSALGQSRLDEAARLVHEAYLETCILDQNLLAYLERLVRTRGDRRTRLEQARTAAKEELPALVLAAEAEFQKHGSEGLLKALRSRLARDLARSGAFDPNPDRPAQAPWADLAERYLMDNRAQVAHVIVKAAHLGSRPAARRGAPLAPLIVQNVTEDMCRCEHDRWAMQAMLGGVRLGEKRNDHLRLHPELKPYSAFSDDERQRIIGKDRDPWLNLHVLAQVAFPEGFEPAGPPPRV